MSERRNSNLLRKITILVLGGLCVNTALALDGSGTQQDPWLIRSLEDFNDFAADPNYWNDYTRLETDVNLAGIVYDRPVIDEFSGVFDGNDHKIMNLTYSVLFSILLNNGEVKNLGLEGDSVEGGGLVQELWEGTISNCYSTVDVNGGSGGWVGGLVGINFFGGEISNCYSTSNVSGGFYAGGIVGSNNGTVSYCCSTGNVGRESSCVGGLVGTNGYNGTVSNCCSTSNVNSDFSGGGLVGVNNNYILNCYSTGDVNSIEQVGGLVGTNNGTVSNCYSTGDVKGVYLSVGGLVGTNNGTVSNCSSTGFVSGDLYVGGLVGSIADHEGSISNCYSTGDVNGVSEVGGLVGRGGNITNCYSNGAVSGDGYVGGLVGHGYNIINCYSTGSIYGNGIVGGLVGFGYNITNCYWDIETSGEPNMCDNGPPLCDNSYGKITTEMMQQSTFTDWDFLNVWDIGENQTYPYLRTFFAADINKDGIVNFLDFAITANQWLKGVE